MSTPSQPYDPDATLVRAPLPPEPEPDPATPKRRRGLVVAAVLGLLLLAVGALYFVGYAMAGDKLPRNAQVAGVAVGGLPREAAVEKLQTEIGPAAEAGIKVSIEEKLTTVEVAEAGLTVDYEESIARAGGGKSFDPRQIWRVLTGGAATGPVMEVDRTKLDAAVAALAADANTEAKNATLAFDGDEIDATKAVDGVELDEEAAAQAIRDAYLTLDGTVELAAEVTQPEVTNSELEQLVEEFAKPAVSAPVEVKATGAGSFEVTPTMIGRSITFQPKDGTLVPVLDPATLGEQASKTVASVELKKPKNATVRLVDGKPKIIPAVNGTQISDEDLAKAVEPVLTRTGDQRSATVQLTGARAKFTTADADNLGVKRVTGEFTTNFPYAEYRNVNIGRAAEKINNTLLKPGETFSLNGIVGERTRANGFVEGFVIKGGRFRKDLGGGVSQSATTTFNAMFFAGLKDIEHSPHGLYINRYPAGREATVAWPTLDLKFGNDSKYGVLVQAYVKKSTPSSQGSITVKMWSTKTYDEVKSSDLRRSNFTTGRNITDDKPDCEPTASVQGFDVNYERIFRNDGQVVRTEKFFWRYSPTDKVTCTR